MRGKSPTEIKTTVEKLGRRVSRTGASKKISYVEAVDAEGTIHRTTRVEKGVNDCGHAGETGALCSVCDSFTICEACAKEGKFLCDACGRVCCPDCSRESLLKRGVRTCRACGLGGIIRTAMGRQK